MLAAGDDAALARLVERVRAARADRSALDIRGGSTKAFLGGLPVGEPLELRELAGISRYEPSELVVTARAGTPLAELEAVLAERGQCLPFEPPRFAPADGDGPAGGTVGGMVAAGLSGPARAAAGSVRDHVLGVSLLDGRAELLGFGGQVIKNVAGYDVARLLAGSMGVLGMICEVSLKVLPLPPATATLRFDCTQAQAIDRLAVWGGQPLPVHASAWWHGTLALRLAGARAAVEAACARLGGEAVDPALATGFWAGLRDQRDEYFLAAQAQVAAGATLWRLALPATTAPLALPGDTLVEWGGAQRWLCTDAKPATVRAVAHAAGGHATRWRGGDRSAASFEPLPPALLRIHRELKAAFDPDGIFNRGRLYPDW
jgi:FAD/FMN-containing dehydrogenase